MDTFKFITYSQAICSWPRLMTVAFLMIPKSVARKFETHNAMTQEMLNRRRESKDDCNDLISNLLKPENHIPDDTLHGNASLLIVAGSETSATALTAVTYYLAKNPKSKEKLIREVRDRFTKVEEINFISVSKLKYLLACLNEALRKYPPAPVPLIRRVPEGGGLIVDNFIPAGVCISSKVMTMSLILTGLLFRLKSVSVY
jgi:cytochrome P450